PSGPARPRPHCSLEPNPAMFEAPSDTQPKPRPFSPGAPIADPRGETRAAAHGPEVAHKGRRLSHTPPRHTTRYELLRACRQYLMVAASTRVQIYHDVR